MKCLTCFLSALVLLCSSCHKWIPKSPEPIIPGDSLSLVSSYSQLVNVSNSMTTDTLRYDDRNRLKSIFHEFINDFTGDKFLDSGTYYFNFTGTDTRPSGYRLVYKKYYQTIAVVEEHELSYDDSSRVSLDSMISTTSTEENIKGKHYTYYPDLALVHIYQQGKVDLLDSIAFPSGNLSYVSESYPDKQGWTYGSSYKREILTDYTNPFSGAGLSKRLGALLLIEDHIDFISRNLTTLQGFFYTWTTDAKGRAVNGTAPDGSFVKFTYR